MTCTSISNIHKVATQADGAQEASSRLSTVAAGTGRTRSRGACFCASGPPSTRRPWPWPPRLGSASTTFLGEPEMVHLTRNRRLLNRICSSGTTTPPCRCKIANPSLAKQHGYAQPGLMSSLDEPSVRENGTSGKQPGISRQVYGIWDTTRRSTKRRDEDHAG